ncbi:MAG: hypothetical protein AAB267_00535, partial [Candidatus Desantisbacteria bacterium]
LVINGEVVKEWKVDKEGEYSVKLPLSLGKQTLVIGSTYKGKEGTDNPLKVEYLKVDSNIIRPALSILSFPIPIQKPFDSPSKTFFLSIEPDKIEGKPESMPLGVPLYEDGTLLQKEEGSELYVLFNNERYSISLLSRKLYGLENKEIKTIGDSIEAIPLAEEELPSYPDKTMIKGTDGKQQVISDGKRWDIPDEETFEAMGLSKIKEREVTIRARARRGYLNLPDPNPMMQLRIDNKPIKEWLVSSTEIQEYKAKIPLSDGKISMDIMSLNGSQSTNGYWLTIEDVKVDGKIHFPSNEAVYDYASGAINYSFNPQLYIDGKYLYEGVNYMLFPGAFRFNLDLDSAISLTDEEMAEIPEGGTLPKSFKDGSLVKSEDRTYFIQQGERRLLSEGYLKLSDSTVITDDRVKELAEADGLPKYPDGIVLTDGTDKYLYTDEKKLKFTSLDELTKQNFTPETGNSTITIDLKSAYYSKQAIPMQLWIDGEMKREWAVKWAGGSFSFDLPLISKKHSIDLIFPNLPSASQPDNIQVITPTNPQIIIDSIKVGDKTIKPEEMKFDAGGTYTYIQSGNGLIIKYAIPILSPSGAYTYAQYKDGTNLSSLPEKITTTGAVRFEAETYPTLTVSKEELDTIPNYSPPVSASSVSSSPISSLSYYISSTTEEPPSAELSSLEGSFIKGGDKTFYVMNGRRRPIPENSLASYIPKDTEVKEVPLDILAKLTLDAPLPEIKYPDGTIIEGAGHRFIIFSGTKHIIDHEPTYKLYGLDQKPVIKFTQEKEIEELASIPTGDIIPLAKVVQENSLGYFLLAGGKRMYIPNNPESLSYYLNAVKQNSALVISNDELLSYAPGEALQKIEPPQPAPP